MRLTVRRILGTATAALAVGAAGLLSTVAPASAAVAPQVVAVFDLNGTYTDGGTARPVISDVNDILTIDMSSQNRPTAHGVVINSDSIVVTFPDDRTYGGKLVAPGTIVWDNFSTWSKLSFATVPNVVGLLNTTAFSVLQSAGFRVSVSNFATCDDLRNHVVSQTPDGGSSAPVGSTIQLQIAQRPTTPCP